MPAINGWGRVSDEVPASSAGCDGLPASADTQRRMWELEMLAQCRAQWHPSTLSSILDSALDNLGREAGEAQAQCLKALG